MSGKSYKHLFKRALAAQGQKLHFAAHSHHPWPDASRNAQIQYWEDSVRDLDDKWTPVFEKVIPAAQGHIATHLKLTWPEDIAFAPNTHEFVGRLLSCLPDRPWILTTDSEFHSFNRQIMRLEEDGLVILRVPVEPFDTFPARFAAEIHADLDLIFFSHVFFNSGYAVPDLHALVSKVQDDDTLVVVDGYHAFMAIPTDLSAIENRAFYIGGGYKYAMAGEGACFMHCPPGYGLRPRDTGWFAEFGALASERNGKVAYSQNAHRFMGATFDASGLYRLNAVMDMLAAEQIDVGVIHSHVNALQQQFIKAVHPFNHPAVNAGTLLSPDMRGHFLTYRTPAAGLMYDRLHRSGIITDHRGDRLRFGFGLYHDMDDVNRLAAAFRP